MSEETTPLLRLKPRLRTDSGAAAAPSPVVGEKPPAPEAPVPTETPAAAPAPRPKTRLTLVGANESANTSTAASKAVPAASPEVLSPAPSVTPDPHEDIAVTVPTTGSPGPIPSLFTVLAPTTPEASPPPAINPADLLPPATAVLTGEAASPMAIPVPKAPAFKTFPKPVHIRSSDAPRTEVVAAPPPAPVRPEHRRAFKVGVVGFAVLGVLVLGVAGYFAFQTFVNLRPPEDRPKFAIKKTPAPASAAAAPASTVAAPATTTATTTVASATTTPSNTVAPADKLPVLPQSRVLNAAKAATTRNTADIDAVLDAGAAATPAPAPANSSAPAPAVVATASPVAETHAPLEISIPPSLPEASIAFVHFADQLRVNGVFQGSPPRAYINGRTVKAGALIDANLGIYFDGIDAGQRQVILRDLSGAIIRKKY